MADPRVHLVEQRREGGEPPPSTLLRSTWNRSAGIFSPARAIRFEAGVSDHVWDLEEIIALLEPSGC